LEELISLMSLDPSTAELIMSWSIEKGDTILEAELVSCFEVLFLLVRFNLGNLYSESTLSASS
jgi:hypothetical protein